MSCVYENFAKNTIMFGICATFWFSINTGLLNFQNILKNLLNLNKNIKYKDYFSDEKLNVF